MNPPKNKNPTGRPKKGHEKGKTAAFSARITPELRARLDASTLETHKTDPKHNLTAEIESRLWKSFDLDDERDQMYERLGGEKLYSLFRLFARVSRMVELWGRESGSDRSWHNDPYLFDQVVAGWNLALKNFRPEGEAVPPQSASGEKIPDRIGEASANGVLIDVVWGGEPGGTYHHRPSKGPPFEMPGIVHGLGELATRIKERMKP